MYNIDLNIDTGWTFLGLQGSSLWTVSVLKCFLTVFTTNYQLFEFDEFISDPIIEMTIIASKTVSNSRTLAFCLSTHATEYSQYSPESNMYCNHSITSKKISYCNRQLIGSTMHCEGIQRSRWSCDRNTLRFTFLHSVFTDRYNCYSLVHH